MTDEPILLTARQAAALLSVSPQKVRNLIADQRLRAVHIDRCVRIHREDLETFADGLRAAPPTLQYSADNMLYRMGFR
jgi:excisionase family DNA binding protein